MFNLQIDTRLTEVGGVTEVRGKRCVPFAFASSSREIMSSFGGASATGVLGSNLPAIVWVVVLMSVFLVYGSYVCLYTRLRKIVR